MSILAELTKMHRAVPEMGASRKKQQGHHKKEVRNEYRRISDNKLTQQEACCIVP
jgi:hypothetical protein